MDSIRNRAPHTSYGSVKNGIDTKRDYFNFPL